MSLFNSFKKNYTKEPTIREKSQIELQRASDLSTIINNTRDFTEFINSYNELIYIFEHLASYEISGIFTGMLPSENLLEIRKKRPLAEKAFLDRYVSHFGKSSLANKQSYFDKFSLEATKYANSLMKSSHNNLHQPMSKAPNVVLPKSNASNRTCISLFDPYFIDAGRYIIELDKASIGMLQREFKIGFNRASKIMDELCSMDVVSEEYELKPRSVLMTRETFEQLVQYLQNHNTSPISNNNNSLPLIFNTIDKMNGLDFETYCANLLSHNGFYNVIVTQESGDHGIDLLAEKDDISYAIQCKCYSSNIGNAAIQQAHTGKSIYRKDIAVVLTNQYFTEQAKEEAAMLGVKLWDRDKLNSLIQSAT